jgi:hypothetical protein
MRSATVLVPLLAGLLAGCADPKSGGLAMNPVTGKVLYDGKPAGGVKVTLVPTDAPMVPKIPQNPHAVTKADGTFAIGTFADADGAAEGGYQLILSWPVDPAEKKPKDDKAEASEESIDADRLMGWYDPLHSNINVRVKGGPNEVPTINIPKVTAPPPVSQGVPGRN